jgi:hypothetical protein
MHTNLHHVLVPHWTCKLTRAQFTTCMYTPLSMVLFSQLQTCCGNRTPWQPSQHHWQLKWHSKWMHTNLHHVLVTHWTCKPTRPNSHHVCAHHYQWCNSLNYKHVVVTEPHGNLANTIAKDNDNKNGCTLTYTMCWWHIEHANQQGPIHTMYVHTIINGSILPITNMLW